MTGVDYSAVDTLFNLKVTPLKKFFGQQAASSKEMDCGIKRQSAFLASENVNYCRNRFWRNSGLRGNYNTGTCKYSRQNKITNPSTKPLIQKDQMV